MKRVITAVLAALIAITALPAAEAAPAKFKSCAAMQKKYPNGVARDQAASQAAQAAGAAVPAVGRAVYTANRGLDRDKDGVACEVVAPAAPKPTVTLTPTGVPDVDALMQSEAAAGVLSQDQATLLYVATGAAQKRVTTTCPLWGQEVFRSGYLNNAATLPVLAAYRLGPEQLPWLRSHLEQVTTLVCRFSGYAV